MGEILELLDRADDLISAVKPHLDSVRLKSVIASPTLPTEEMRSGLTWLLRNYGHIREHIGHIQLTKQLYQEQRPAL